ncbi:MAG: hypothetical protein N838_22260 [Thiohalocapsa sp. PB-PSB1]|jgi:hypothetical protein|nr:MAG: hypothetical protein N838_22260 [Thiohalocapsa sp. PB-PSB1]
MQKYERTCLDEIDFENAAQMHAAALQLSQTCFDFKKLCVSLLGASSALLIKFGSGGFSHAVFFVGVLLIFGFWLSDATSYFYQRKLRSGISAKHRSIAKRNGQEIELRDTTTSPIHAAFNSSMALYYVLAGVFAVGWLAYGVGAL